MGYQLRMHRQIRDWLSDLAGAEPELARVVGEAVLALLEAGETLGPPLVVPLGSAPSPPDPREALDYAYQRLLEALQTARRGIANAATSRKRVELHANQLEINAGKLSRERQDALDVGLEDLASEARAREAVVHKRIDGLRHQLAVMRSDEDRVVAASQLLQAKVEAFRIRKETINATYAADEASRTVREALADLSADLADANLAGANLAGGDPADGDPAGAGPAGADPAGLGRDAGGLAVTGQADAPSGFAGAAAAAGDVLKEISNFTRTFENDSGVVSGVAGQGGVLPAAGMKELRPGAPDGGRAGLLFVIEPQDTAVLVAWVENPGRSPEAYRDVMPLAIARAAMAQSGGPSPSVASVVPGVFTSYDAESFLDEFFPGAATEVEIGAATLVARNRALTLVQARERKGLTQAQVAARMNIRQDRVAAIERAEPGATEVRTLAAYVSALGGRLEIIANINDERITLR